MKVYASISPTVTYYDGTSNNLVLSNAKNGKPVVDTATASYRYYGGKPEDQAYVKESTVNGNKCLKLSFRSAIVVMRLNFDNIGAIGVKYMSSGNSTDGASMGLMPDNIYDDYVGKEPQTNTIREDRNNWMYNNYYTLRGAGDFTYYVNTQSETGEHYFYIGAYGDGTGAASLVTVKAIYIYPKLTVTNPSSVIKNVGDIATFSVTSNGDTFQWYRNGTVISGATSSSYSRTVTSDDNDSTYYCRVSDSSFGDQTNVVYLDSGSATISIPTYTLTYNANGGSGSMSSQSFLGGTTIQISSNGFTKSGYQFNGWNTSSNGSGTSYSAGSTYGDDSSEKCSVTLFAQWRPISYTVTYHGNSNTGGSTESQTFEQGSSVVIRSCGFYKTGYSFTGEWKDGLGNVYTPNQIYSSHADLDLYVQWKPTHYKVAFNYAGGTSGGTNTALGYNDQIPGLDGSGHTEIQYSGDIDYDRDFWVSNPYRTGYTFTGWSLECHDTNTAKYFDGISWNQTGCPTKIKDTGFINLRQDYWTDTAGNYIWFNAIWEPNKYGLTWNPNGDLVDGVAYQSGLYTTVTYGSSNVSHIGTTYTRIPDWAKNGRTYKTGYIFLGWYDASSGGNQVFDASGNYTTNGGYWSSDGTWVKTNNVTLYAQWKPIKYNVMYHGNGNFNTSQGDYEHPCIMEYGKTYTLETNKFSRDVSKYPYSVDNTYVGSYTFLGWGKTNNQKYADFTDCQSVSNLTTVDGAIVDLYAIWKRDVNLKFNLNGGSFD